MSGPIVKSFIRAAFFSSLPYFIASAYATQDILSEVQRQQDQVITREEERQKVLQEQFQDHQAPREKKEVETQKPSKKTSASLVFKEIQLEGANLLSEHEKKDLVRQFIDKPILVSQLDDILRTITNYYVGKGYSTTRAYLVPQNIKSGILKIKVIEGRIDQLTVKNEEGHPHSRQNAIPCKPGDNLNIRDLEQGIDQIKRMPSFDARMELEPGETEGGSKVVIHTAQKYPFSFTGTMDNYGSKSTGQNQGEVQLTVDNLLNLYDSWSMNLRKNMDLEDWDHHSRSLTLQGSVPYAYWTFRYAGTFFQYLSTVTGKLQFFQFSGTSDTHRGEVERIIHRDENGKTGLMGFLTTKTYRNYIKDALLKTGSYRLTLVGGRFFHVRRFWNGTLSLSATYTRGTRILGAIKKESPFVRHANPLFKKYNFDVSYAKPFAIFTQAFTFLTHISGQYSGNELFSSERLGFGGATTVRGFQDTSLNGTRGLFARNEVAWTICNFENHTLKTACGIPQAFVGFDYGWIQKHNDDTFERGVLRSACVGFRFTQGVTVGEIGFARSFSRPGFLKDEGEIIHLKFGITF